MTFRTSIDRLGGELSAMEEALESLSRRATDSPPDNASQLAQRLADAADAMTGWAAEAADSLAVPTPARLVDAHRCALRIAGDLGEWTAYERTADLVAAGQEGGRRGQEWSLDVRDALETAGERLERVEHAVLAGWQELAETDAARGVTVHNVSVGPHVSFARAGQDGPPTNGGESGGG